MRRLVLPADALRVPPEGPLELPPEVAKHLRVLRLGPGDPLQLTDGEGRRAVGVLDTLDKKRATVLLESIESVPLPEGPEIYLLQGVGKGDKLDTVTRQVAELGARRLVPVASARAVAQRDNKTERLRVIADDALRVSGRAHRMRVDDPMSFEAALEIDAQLKLVFAWEDAEPLRAQLEDSRPASVALLVGPEGGFSPEELARAAASGYRRTHLGPHTLRTETAGPAVVAMVRYALDGA